MANGLEVGQAKASQKVTQMGKSQMLPADQRQKLEIREKRQSCSFDFIGSDLDHATHKDQSTGESL